MMLSTVVVVLCCGSSVSGSTPIAMRKVSCPTALPSRSAIVNSQGMTRSAVTGNTSFKGCA